MNIEFVSNRFYIFMGKTNSVNIIFFLILSDYIQKIFHLKKSLTFDWHSSEIYYLLVQRKTY